MDQAHRTRALQEASNVGSALFVVPLGTRLCALVQIVAVSTGQDGNLETVGASRTPPKTDLSLASAAPNGRYPRSTYYTPRFGSHLLRQAAIKLLNMEMCVSAVAFSIPQEAQTNHDITPLAVGHLRARPEIAVARVEI